MSDETLRLKRTLEEVFGKSEEALKQYIIGYYSSRRMQLAVNLASYNLAQLRDFVHKNMYTQIWQEILLHKDFSAGRMENLDPLDTFFY